MNQVPFDRSLRVGIAALLLLAAPLIGCGGSGVPAEAEAPAEGTTPAESEVEYEPAYPEEVSSEELSDADTAQQDAAHDSDDGHTHGPGTHTHDGDDEEGHAHDEEDDDHEH